MTAPTEQDDSGFPDRAVPDRTAEGDSTGDSAKERARRRIVKAARTAMAVKGLDTTVDDVAEIAGISRRTVFRHFGTRDHLLATALRAGLESYGANLPLHDEGEDVEHWLRRFLAVVHEFNEGNGRIYWELNALQPRLEGELAEAADARRRARLGFVRRVTSKLWELSGGAGEPPEWLSDTVAVHVSGFTTQALRLDFGRSAAQVADVSVQVLLSASRTAVAEQTSA